MVDFCRPSHIYEAKIVQTNFLHEIFHEGKFSQVRKVIAIAIAKFVNQYKIVLWKNGPQCWLFSWFLSTADLLIEKSYNQYKNVL